jgi:hypothetical protein
MAPGGVVDQEVAAGLARIEQRQAAYEVVAHRILGMLEVHNEKLDAILQAATVEPGPSPVADSLKQILVAMNATTAALQDLPEAIATTIREELQRDEEDEWEPAEGAFDEPNEEKP